MEYSAVYNLCEWRDTAPFLVIACLRWHQSSKSFLSEYSESEALEVRLSFNVSALFKAI